MCKLLLMSGVTDETRENAVKFVKEISEKMSWNPNNDGLGYAAVTKDNKLFGERWHKNDEAFKNRNALTELDSYLKKKYRNLIHKEIKYNTFGELDMDNMTSITLHTRNATSGKEFYNTHPFVDEETGTSLIHNGVIHNTKELERYISTCDSECILNEYVAWDVAAHPEDIQSVAECLQGFYACGVFAKDNNGKYFLDIFKNLNSSLHGVFVEQLNTMVFSTSLDDIERTCNQLNFNMKATYECIPGVLLRLDAITGESICDVSFKPEYNKHKIKTEKKQEDVEQDRMVTVLEKQVTKTQGDYTSFLQKNGSKQIEKKETLSATEFADKFRERTKHLEEMNGWFRDNKNGAWKQKKNG